MSSFARWRRDALLLAVFAFASELALAFSGGITGQSVAGCTGCHTANTYTGYVARINGASGGSSTVAPSSMTAFTTSTTHSGTAAPKAGFNLSVNIGSLTAGGDNQLAAGELTHNSPGKLTSGGDVSWSFTYNAPASVGTCSMFVCTNPVNNAGDGAAGDGPSDCNVHSITVNRTPNSNPDSFIVLEDSGSTSFNVLANDTSGSSSNDGGDTIEVTHINGASVTSVCPTTVAVTSGTVCRSSTNPGNTLTFTPAANFSGGTSFTYQVTDSLGAISTADAASITVTDVNDAPTLNAIGNPAAINEDASQQTVNLAGIGDGSTFESQTLTVTASSNNTAVIPNPTVTYTSPSATGSIAYTPVANQSGSAIITVTVTDNGGTANGGVDTISRTFTVTVNSVNDEPTLNAIANPAAINEDAGQQTVNLSGIGAGGGESQTLTVTASSSNTAVIPNPTVTYTSPNATGSLVYTPVANANGSAIVTVTLTDSGGTANGGDDTVQRTFTVTVNAVNDAPVAVNDTASVSKNSTGNSLDPLANDTDADAGDTRTIVSVGTPSNGGSVSIVGAGQDNTLSYSPATNYSGPETISYTMRDTAMVTSSATINVTVGTGVAPAALDDSATVLEDSPANAIDVLLNDTDADSGDTKEIVAVNGSSTFPVATTNGSVSLSGTGPDNQLLYTPAANFFGSDSFTYTVRDAGLLTDTGTVNVTVTGINDAPTLNGIANPAAINEDAVQQTVNLSGIGAGSGESQTLTITATSDNTALILNPTVTYTSPNASGSLSYTPVANANGSAIVTVTVTDNGGTANGGVDSVQRTFTVSVNSVNDAPTLNSVANPATINEDAGQQTVNLSGIGAGGGESQSLTVTAVSANTALIPNPTVTYTSPSATGSLAYTPVANANGSAIVTVTVTDNGGTANGGVDSVQRTFTVNVGAANDAPVVAVIPDQTVADNQLFSYTVSVTDADGETSFTYSLANAPAGMSISSGGQITWTPPIGTSGLFSPTVQAEDAASAMGTRAFNLTVNSPDSDGDGMPDSYEDLYPAVLDKNDPTDANEDPDRDGLTNLEEYAQLLDPTVDDVAPVLGVPADLIVPATGYFTVVDLGEASAVDGKDGVLTPASDWTFPVVRPGRYIVNWTVQDLAGNVATDTQQVDVLPLAELNVDQVSGEGASVNVTVTLNGAAPQYPVTIPYTVGGSASAGDSDAVAGSFTIASGTSATVPVAIAADGPGEPAETVIFTMTGADQAALGARRSHTIMITEANAAPLVSLSALQSAFPRLVAYQDDGVMTISATASDPNGDALSFDWSDSADLLGVDGVTISDASFDPAGLAAGVYLVRVTVADAGAQASASLLLTVAAGASTEVDVDADGILDGADSVVDYAALLEDQSGNPALAELLETDPGLSLRRGRTSLAAGRTGALIVMSDIVTFGIGEGGLPLGADSFDNVGGIFDFEIHGLAVGGTARVVLPLQTAIRSGAVFRKFDPDTGWGNFVSDARNGVASAFSSFGQCPGPASDEYQSGLQVFADCVRLTFEDGGPNDADGAANSVIADPGGVAVASLSSGGGGGSRGAGGGALLGLVLPLLALAAFARRQRRSQGQGS